MSPCCVPFCRRTTRRPNVEWLCGPHYRRVPLRMRRVYLRARVRALGFAELAEWKRPPRYITAAFYGPDLSSRGFYRLWDRIKREAVARATDLGSF